MPLEYFDFIAIGIFYKKESCHQFSIRRKFLNRSRLITQLLKSRLLNIQLIDPQADWEGLAASLRGGLSWGLSGGPYYATDVGGFYGDQRDPMLYVRWAQAGVYSAHMRLHGIGPREPWSYGKEAEAAAMTALRKRYRLIPYLRQTMQAAHTHGLPVQRAMSLACPDEPAAWRFDTQFFFGEDLLVAPCLDPKGQVEVYLPEGDWIRFPNRTRHTGARVLRFSLALNEDCVFARAGATIPLGPDVLHTGQLTRENGDIAALWPEHPYEGA